MTLQHYNTATPSTRQSLSYQTLYTVHSNKNKNIEIKTKLHYNDVIHNYETSWLDVRPVKQSAVCRTGVVVVWRPGRCRRRAWAGRCCRTSRCGTRRSRRATRTDTATSCWRGTRSRLDAATSHQLDVAARSTWIVYHSRGTPANSRYTHARPSVRPARLVTTFWFTAKWPLFS